MTPLRFRAWHKEKKVLVYDNEDDSSDYWDGCVCSNVRMVNNLLRDEEYVWMQSTGLKDKNGKEIFEGDFLHVADRHYVVKWSEHKSGWHVEALGGEKHRTIGYCRLFGKVIGNVWENPDLLNPPTKTP